GGGGLESPDRPARRRGRGGARRAARARSRLPRRPALRLRQGGRARGRRGRRLARLRRPGGRIPTTGDGVRMLDGGMRVRVGIVGMGYWGPNLARNLATLESCELAWCCELDDEKRQHWESAYPQATFTADFDDLLNDPDLTAIVVATPGSTHAALGRKVLEAGKNCFIEKPLAPDTQTAAGLVRLAAARGLGRMCGHPLCAP